MSLDSHICLTWSFRSSFILFPHTVMRQLDQRCAVTSNISKLARFSQSAHRMQAENAFDAYSRPPCPSCLPTTDDTATASLHSKQSQTWMTRQSLYCTADSQGRPSHLLLTRRPSTNNLSYLDITPWCPGQLTSARSV